MPIIDDCIIAKEPLQHQLTAWRERRDAVGWAHFWDTGTGKTCETFMQAAWLYQQGKIDGMFVLAPNDIHRNWITEEMPQHWPAEIPSMACWYRTSKAGDEEQIERLKALISTAGFAVLSMSTDSIMTEDRKEKRASGTRTILAGRSWAKEFLTRRRCLMVVDESWQIKTPGAQRTKRIHAAGTYARFRRALNGTPIDNRPFDLYAQIKFLDPEFWKSRGIGSYEGFKTQFGLWGVGKVQMPNGTYRKYPRLDGYRNLDTLRAWVREISDRVLKDDVLDLPPRTYQRLVFDMAPAQRRVYDDIEKDSVALLQSGESITASMALVRLLRLRQVACGYAPTDEAIIASDPEPHRDVCDDNPRLRLLGDVCEGLGHKAIVWATFTRDIDLIMSRLAKMDLRAVRYDGQTDDDERAAAFASFSRGDAQFFVAHPGCAGAGLTLLGDQSDERLACRTVVYYSNGLSLRERLQSEARADRFGRKLPLHIIDLVAARSVDERLLKLLRNKHDVACEVTGDVRRDWGESVRVGRDDFAQLVGALDIPEGSIPDYGNWA